MNMPSSTAGWFGTTASGSAAFTDVRPAPGPLPSPQYGPAWVADCYGTSHVERATAVFESGVTMFDPNDRDAVAVAYAALTE